MRSFSLLVLLLACVFVCGWSSSTTTTPGVVAQALRRPRTVTATQLAIRPGTLQIERQDMQYLRLSRAGVFPKAFMDVRILNASFTLASEGCVEALAARPYATGPGWIPELLPAKPSPLSQREPSLMRITFEGTALFDAKENARADTSYFLKLPSSCTSDVLSSTLKFNVADTRSSQLAGICAFALLLAGTVSMLAVLGGSLFAYVPVQLAVMLAAHGCAPLDMQREGYTVTFVISPLPYMSREQYPHYRGLMLNLLIFFFVALCDTAYFIVLYRTSVPYAQRLVASLKGKREVFLSTYKPKPDDQYPVPEEDVKKRPLPFYMLFCSFALFGGGVVYHAARVLTFEATSVQHYGAAAVGLVVWLIFFVICISLSFTKGAYYKPFSSSKKKLPRVITPEGTTGPNAFRLTAGVIVSDMRQGRRYAASLPVLYVGIVAALVGCNVPSESGCRTTLSVAFLVTALYAVFLYRSRPLRSTAANVLGVAMLVAVLFVIACLLVWAGYGGHAAPDSNSGAMTIVALIVLAVLAIVSGLLSCVVALWEGAGGEAMRAAKYSDGKASGLMGMAGEGGVADGTALAAPGAEVFERHVAFLVEDMKQLIDAGGGQPLDPDDTGAGMNLFGPSPSASAAAGSSASPNGRSAAPTLATFLMQDFEALPKSTQDALVTSDRIAKQAQLSHLRTSGGQQQQQQQQQQQRKSTGLSSYSML